MDEIFDEYDNFEDEDDENLNFKIKGQMALEVNQIALCGLGGTGINTLLSWNMLRKEMCGPDGTFLMRKHPELELRPLNFLSIFKQS